MEFALEPMTDQAFSESDGGAYYNWPSSQFPVLSHADVAAGRLVLRRNGFALPHYADSSKVGYVMQGNGVVGLVFPNESKEQVLKLNKGDAIPVPAGIVSWWFNGGGDSDLEIIFLGETSNSHIHGEITYFLLAGAQGILSTFSPDFISKAYNLNSIEEANKLTRSQSGILIVKLPPGKSLPEPQPLPGNMVFNLAGAEAERKAAFGASVKSVEESKFPFIGQTGLSASLEKLCSNGVRSPVYAADSSVQVIYVVSGSGRVEIVGFDGVKMAAGVKAGDLVVVPKYFAIGKEAGEDGMEFFSIVTNARAVIEELGGKASVWEALSEEVLQVSFNVSADFEKMFISKAAN